MVVLAFGARVPGAIVTVPNEFESDAGGSMLDTVVRNEDKPRTYQVQIAADELGAIAVGSAITQLRWRLADHYTTSFPPQDATWDQYEITLAQAANSMGDDFSTNFAANMLNPVQVRSGPMTIEDGAFPWDGAPDNWGPWISFDVGYEYGGGDLVILYTHTGHDIADKSLCLDAVGTENEDYGIRYRAQRADAYQASLATLLDQNFTITQFNVGPSAASLIPEPASVLIWSLLGVAFFGVGLRRPRRN
jgi:hypothetical protein